MIRGLDHISVAVRDLEQSRADYQALGFVLKPGRLHENGLRNSHVKFADGTEIELITAPAPTDALATKYFTELENGDGPVFLGFYAREDAALVKRLSELGLALEWSGSIATLSHAGEYHRLFFAHRQNSPSDRPEHFAHGSTAFRLAGVWLAGAVAEQGLLVALGAVPNKEPACGPFGSPIEALSLPDGEIMFLADTARLTPGRPIIGATVSVTSLEAARRVLAANRVPFRRMDGCGRHSLWIDPSVAHGLWLEFRE